MTCARPDLCCTLYTLLKCSRLLFVFAGAFPRMHKPRMNFFVPLLQQLSACSNFPHAAVSLLQQVQMNCKSRNLLLQINELDLACIVLLNGFLDDVHAS